MRRRAPRLERLGGGEGGAVAVEFALVSVLAITLILAVVEFGRVFYVRSEIAYGLDRAVRVALNDPDTPVTALRTALQDGLSFPGAGDVVFTVTEETADGESFDRLRAEYEIMPIIPVLGDQPIRLSVSRHVPRP